MESFFACRTSLEIPSDDLPEKAEAKAIQKNKRYIGSLQLLNMMMRDKYLQKQNVAEKSA